jgi:hypothetical protein
MKISPFLVVAASVLAFNCTQSMDREKIIIDVPSLANKNQAEVVALLGKPDSTYTEYIVSKSIPVYRYSEQGIVLDIQFWDGKATDMIVADATPLPFTPATLEVFGIPVREPASQSRNVFLKWEKLQGLRNINFYVTDYKEDKRINKYKIFFKADKS